MGNKKNGLIYFVVVSPLSRKPPYVWFPTVSLQASERGFAAITASWLRVLLIPNRKKKNWYGLLLFILISDVNEQEFIPFQRIPAIHVSSIRSVLHGMDDLLE